MKNFVHAFALSTLSAALISGAAYAQDLDQPMGFSAKTLREIYHANERASTAPTVRQTAIVDDADLPLGFLGKSKRDMFPSSYEPAKSSLSREQVRSETIRALNSGDIPSGFLARTGRELTHGAARGVEPSSDLARY